MKWEKEAREVVDAIPIHDIIKNLIVLYAEKLARKNKSKVVGMKEVTQTRDDYFEFLGAETMERIQKVRDEGKSDDAIDPMIELNKGLVLYNVELCHSRFFGCNRDLIGVVDIGKKVKERMENLNITELLADKAFEPLLPHSTFTVSISGCANACTSPESRDMGVFGVAIPEVTDVECNQCGKCAHVCMDGLVHYEDGKPVIDENNCVLCGACITLCPTGTIKAKQKGFNITAGGYLGRWKRYGKEIFRITDESKIYSVIDACTDLIRREWKDDREDHFNLVVKRCGVDSIHNHVRKSS
jgi:ferredoxin